MTDTPVLELSGVSKSFGAVQALYEVDFRVASGEVMALVGDNGAGKSTLIKCIAGIHPADSGEIRFEGRPVNIHGPKDAADLGIEVVYQDLALCDNLDVVHNMFLGRELTSSGLLDEAPDRYLSRFHYDCLVHDERALRLLVERVGADRVVIGTDHPYGGDIPEVGAVRWIADQPFLTSREKDMVVRENATAFLDGARRAVGFAD